MKIGVIEDEHPHRMLLCEEIKKWGLDRDISVMISEYESAEAFLFDWEEQLAFDVLFIDIQMRQMDGIEMARKIREKDQQVALVFTTGVAEWMSVGYEVEALHYLLKPLKAEKVWDCLDRVEKRTDTHRYLTFKGEDGVYRLDETAIYMVEAQGHNCRIAVKEDKQYSSYLVRESFTQVSYKLAPEIFVKCHRSYLCGLRHIHHIEKNTLTFDNQEKIPVSRQMYTKVNEAFIQFYKQAREREL